MIARRLDEAMAKHKARNQQGVEQDFVVKTDGISQKILQKILQLTSDIITADKRSQLDGCILH